MPRLTNPFRKAERVRLGGAEAEADDLAPAVIGGNRHNDYCRDRHDTAAVTDLEVGGVEPQIRPLALDRPLQEGVDPLVNILAQLGDLALRDAG